jgi:nucleotide-binding universal stress UspA family protein
MKTIVVGYDGSEHSERALERAITMAGNDTEIVVVSAAEPLMRSGGFAGTRDVDPADAQAASDHLDKAQVRLREAGVRARAVEAHVKPAEALVEQAKEHGAELIIVGKRGLNALERSLLGSVSTKVVHDAGCDVLVTAPQTLSGLAATVVVGYDGSEHADRALDRAVELAAGGEVVVVSTARLTLPVRASMSAADPVEVEASEASLEAAKQRLSSQGVDARFVEGHGDAADVLIQEAEAAQASLIVVGTRGLNMTQRAVLGSVSTRVVMHRALTTYSSCVEIGLPLADVCGGRVVGLLVEQIVRNRIADELGAGRESQLLHDVCPVGLRRANGDVEQLGDLLVRVPERKQA